MGRTKLQRFNNVRKMKNIVEFDQENIKDSISKFIDNKPVILELACGRGEYTIELAELLPEKKFIGIDYQGERLWYGGTVSTEKDLTNTLFVRAFIDKIEEYIEPNSIDEIWITFSDPQVKKARKRITSPNFLKKYQKILKPKGLLHLKTDSQLLFEYSLTSLENNDFNIIELNNNVTLPNSNPLLNIQTYFETKHRLQNEKIYYLKSFFTK